MKTSEKRKDQESLMQKDQLEKMKTSEKKKEQENLM
jgi:hypothetical protein